MTPSDGAAALPGWLPWLPVVVHTAAAFSIGALATGLAAVVALGVRPRLATRHWIDRARVAAPARTAARIVLLLTVGYAATTFGAICLCEASWLAARVHVPLVLVAGYLGATLVQWRLERRITGAPVSWREWLRGRLCFFLLVPAVPIALAAWVLVPTPAGPATLVAATVFTALVVRTAAGLRVGRLLGVARPPSARVAAIVERASARTNTRPRAVYEVAMSMANAVALPLSQTICLTDGLLAVADDGAIEAILAHELGHLADRRALLPLDAVAILAPAGALALGSLSDPWVGWGVVVAWLVASVLIRRWQRRREVHADAVAHASVEDTTAYARALELGYEANVLPVVGSRPTHPDLYDRLLAAGVTPDYPRPRRPSRARTIVAAIAGVGCAAALLYAVIVVPWLWRMASPDALLPNLAVLSVDPTNVASVDLIANMRRRAGDRAAAVALYYAAADAHPKSAYAVARLAFVLAGAGRCGDARTAARDTLERGHCGHCTRRARRILEKCARDPRRASGEGFTSARDGV
jgi:Zn-dependent protease with chaperone function